jgi:peptide deformylase
MSLLNILQFPDPRLKKIATPVATFDDEILSLITNMFETMYEAQGVGLAATQVNVHKRVIVLDVSNEQNQPLALINPEIVTKLGVLEREEGCLSFPGVYAKVKRYQDIEIKYRDHNGKLQSLKANGGLLSACIQHEIDHLDGITFFDHLSLLKRELLEKKLEKNRKRAL